MTDAQSRIDAFFAAQGPWQAELAALRALLLGCGLTGDFKWRSPVYTVDGGNVAILWGFKDHAGLGFFKGVLLNDGHGLLVPPGDNSRSVRMVKFTSVAEIAAAEIALKDYIRQAIGVETAGLKVALPKDDLPYPEELVARLEADPAFKAAFAALTPGRRRGYVLHVSQPKKSETRTARIEKSLPNVFAGKGFDGR
jgi:uncharacterized protein YdeI (YjbR/CyaY-like superfamily)